MSEGRWIKLCHVDDLWDREIRGFEIDGYHVAVLKMDSEIRAYYGLCPHALGPMEEFYFEEDAIVCPAHLWTFDARTGAGINPESSHLVSFEVQVKEGEVYVKLPSIPAKEWLTNNLRYGLA